MKSLENCVVESMDGTDPAIFPFLPYILQDLWELGTDPAVISNLIKEYFGQESANKKVLDLGCGKGTVSVRLALDLESNCTGIDAIPEFVMDARQLSKQHGVADRCTFEVGDVRQRLGDFKGFDVVVLGSTGSIFGDYVQSLTAISGCLTKDGIVILDEGYIEDDKNFVHPSIYKKSDLFGQFNRAGFTLLRQVIVNKEAMEFNNNHMFERIVIRCNELYIQK